MPRIDVYAPAGTFRDRAKLVRAATASTVRSNPSLNRALMA